MPSHEELPSPLYEEIAFREELGTIINDHYRSGDIAVIQDDDLNDPAEIIFAGRLRARPPLDHLAVEVSILPYKGGEVINIGIGGDEYTVAKEGILRRDIPEYFCGETELMKLRRRMSQTRWSKMDTALSAQKLEG